MENENKESEVITNIDTESKQEQKTTSGYSIAALVLGIVSILFSSSFVIGVACGVLSIIFGNKYRTMQKMAKAGFILGIIGTSLSGISFLDWLTILF